MLSTISLGCFRNTVDTEQFLSRLQRKGFKPGSPDASVVFINTCAFVEDAKKESLDEVGNCIALKKQGRIKKIIVGGCLVRRYYKELIRAYPEIDALVDIEGLSEGQERTAFLDKKPYVFLKIAEGCNWNCSYCAIPLIKGKYQSRGKDDIIDEVKRLDDLGFKELVVIAQDTTSWGLDHTGSKSFRVVTLAEKIAETVRSIRWIRFLYFHPLSLSREFIDLIAGHPRLCKYIDLPIQHISRRILRLMKREATRQKIFEHIAYIRSRPQKIALRTTVIVGFPTETNKDFQELYTFVKDTRFDHLGAFMYSPEDSTPAGKLVQIAGSVKKRRYNSIMRLQQKISADQRALFIGTQTPVLIEERLEKGIYQGRTEYDAPDIDGTVTVRTNKRMHPGSIVPLTITNAREYFCEGVYD